MKPRLLIVDDHPVVARGVAALLAPLFTTDTSCAQSGSEALKFVSSALHSQPYTLAIIDDCHNQETVHVDADDAAIEKLCGPCENA